jgi:NAD+ synthase (glutamine-hydrolysing)
MKIALLQINPTVGDIAGNVQLIADAAAAARREGADLAVTPELALAGYLPRDLLLNAGFVSRCWEAVASLATTLSSGPAVLVGLPEPNP